MFEKALVYRAGVKTKVDIGLLAETLFFYGKTHLLLDRASIQALAKTMPQEVLLDLFDSDVLSLSYIRQSFAVFARGIPPGHDFGAIRLEGNVDGTKLRNYQDDIAYALETELGKSTKTTRFAQKIADRASLHRFRGIAEKEKVVPDLTRSDLADPVFVHNAVKLLLAHWLPDFSAPFTFRLLRSEKGDYFVDTDLDFKALNEAYDRSASPRNGPITILEILREIYDARADTFFAAYYMAEPVTARISSDLMMLKHFEFLRRRQASTQDFELFHEIIVPEFPTIREVINSGERSIEELIGFLEQAVKFKKWLTQSNPDVGLIQNYYKEVTRKSWIETLPGKAVRFVIAASSGFAATSTLGPIGGLGVGVTNSFLLDRLLKGWRPNRFIEGPYKKFVGPEE
jgi:hypothetical protein